MSVTTLLPLLSLMDLPISWACTREIVGVRVLSEIQFLLSVSFSSECECFPRARNQPLVPELLQSIVTSRDATEDQRSEFFINWRFVEIRKLGDEF